MIHDLYLRAHTVVPGDTSEQAQEPAQRSRSPKRDEPQIGIA